MALRWMEDGFHRPDAIAAEGKTTTRNLLGFKDGTANPSLGSDLFADLVWVAPDDTEPELGDGRQLHGRAPDPDVRGALGPRAARGAGDDHRAVKRTGSPLGGHREEEIPDYASDPEGAVTALDAHIRMANPRTAGSERNLIFRRGYSFSRGFDGAGLLDQGSSSSRSSATSMGS